MVPDSMIGSSYIVLFSLYRHTDILYSLFFQDKLRSHHQPKLISTRIDVWRAGQIYPPPSTGTPPPLYPEKVLIFFFCRVADKQCQLAARYFQLIGEYWWGERNKRSQHTQHLLGLFVFFTRSVRVSTIQFLYLIGSSSSSSGEKNKKKKDYRTPFFFFFFPLFFTRPWVRDTVFTNQTAGTRHFWIFFGAHTHTHKQQTSNSLSLSPWWSCAKMPKSSNLTKKYKKKRLWLSLSH